jgi:hypothetical protein
MDKNVIEVRKPDTGGSLDYYSFFDKREKKELLRAKTVKEVNEAVYLIEDEKKKGQFFFLSLRTGKKSRCFKGIGRYFELGNILWIKDEDKSVFLNFLNMKETKRYSSIKEIVPMEDNSILVKRKGLFFSDFILTPKKFKKK